MLKGISGYELRSNIDKDHLLGKDRYEGVPTSQAAFLYLRGFDLSKLNSCLTDISPTILDLLNIPVDDKIDGRSIL